jgi:channel protein (hemolysin III family)
VGSALLHRLSDDCWEKITAWIYGMGLCALFIVSTVFHIVSWKKSHLRYSGRGRWAGNFPCRSSSLTKLVFRSQAVEVSVG